MLQSRRTPLVLVLLVALFSLTVSVGSQQVAAAPAADEYDSDHIIVGWDRSLPEQARADVHARTGGEVANRLEFIDVDVVEVPENQDPIEWVARYERHPTSRSPS